MQTVKATTINDLWFQALYKCYNHGIDHVIDSGSYAGQTRRQFNFFAGEIEYPETRPLSIVMPDMCPVPSPNDEEKVAKYFTEYLAHSEMAENETYTYGSRIWNFPNLDGSTTNQIEWVINHFKAAPGNNHCCITIPLANDLNTKHAPCLRLLDFKIVNNKLAITCYFRSWDLWSGLPTNLAGFQILNEYVAQEIDIDTGKMFMASAGLHLYSMYFDVAKQRLGI